MDLASLAWVCPGNRSFAGPSCLSSYSCRVAWFAPRKYGRARVACFLGGACRIRVRIASRGPVGPAALVLGQDLFHPPCDSHPVVFGNDLAIVGCVRACGDTRMYD